MANTNDGLRPVSVIVGVPQAVLGLRCADRLEDAQRDKRSDRSLLGRFLHLRVSHSGANWSDANVSSSEKLNLGHQCNSMLLLCLRNRYICKCYF